MKRWTLASALVLAAAPLVGQTVTSPGVYTNNTGTTYNDAIVPNTWVRREVRNGSSIGIDATYYQPGETGSLFMSGENGVSKGDFEYNFAAPTALAGFTSASYDWLRDPLSDVEEHLVPVFRFLVYDPTNASFGILVAEPIYDIPDYEAPEGSWQSFDLTNAGFWLRQGGTNCFYGQTGTNTISEWVGGASATCETGGPRSLSSSTLVYGVNVGFGSGWNGPFQGAVDHVQFAFLNGPSGDFDFEVTGGGTGQDVVPEPATMTLLATGLAGMVAARRRKGKQSVSR